MADVRLTGVNHIGIRVRELARSLEFYAHLGFTQIWYSEPEHVLGLRNPTGIELNLIVNAAADGPNVLMDVPQKHAGYTHVSFRVASIEDTVAQLAAAGIRVTEGPIDLGGHLAVFIRDPDGNVIELAAPTPPRPNGAAS
jgi:lactoylglutathione lyase